MSKELDELLALVRSGEANLWIQKQPDPDELKQRMMDPNFTEATLTKLQVQIFVEHKSDKEKTLELIQVLNNHPNEIYTMLAQGDAQVCMLPAQHWPTYEKIEEDELPTYYRCNLCVEDRAQMIDEFLPLLSGPVPPKEPAAILDFQAHQKKKRED